MTHVFMYPRVTQIAPRAHTVTASSLGTRRQPVHHAPDANHPRPQGRDAPVVRCTVAVARGYGRRRRAGARRRPVAARTRAVVADVVPRAPEAARLDRLA